MIDQRDAARVADRGIWARELEGKTAIVTGAGRRRGIGRAIALELAKQGVNVVLTGTNRDPLSYPPDERAVGWRDIDSVADEIRAIGSQALSLVVDVGDFDAVSDLFARTIGRFGAVDILINNASSARANDRTAIVDLPLDEWDRVMRVNLTGAFLCAQAAARRMVVQGRGGVILNISTVGARTAPASSGAYCASKAGLGALSRSLAMELAGHRIRVNTVMPGIIETSRMDDLGRDEKWERLIAETVPLGSAGNGAEIAHMCTYLCSNMAAWITGQEIAVDGGATWR